MLSCEYVHMRMKYVCYSAHFPRGFSVADYIKYLSIFIDFLILSLTINPNPPCQLSLSKETVEPGENPRLVPRAIRCSIPGLEPMTSGGRPLLI